MRLRRHHIYSRVPGRVPARLFSPFSTIAPLPSPAQVSSYKISVSARCKPRLSTTLELLTAAHAHQRLLYEFPNDQFRRSSSLLSVSSLQPDGRSRSHPPCTAVIGQSPSTPMTLTSSVCRRTLYLRARLTSLPRACKQSGASRTLAHVRRRVRPQCD